MIGGTKNRPLSRWRPPRAYHEAHREFLRTLLGLICLCFVPAMAFGEEEPEVVENDDQQCQVREVEGGIHCLYVDGHVEWERIHPSLWRDEKLYLDRDTEPADVGIDEELNVPAPTQLYQFGDRLFYTVFRDLIEVDEETGKTVQRVRFPAPIAGVEMLDDRRLDLILSVDRELSSTESYEFQLTYSLEGPEPAQTFWGTGVPGFANSHDADWLVADLDEDAVEEAIGRLSAAWHQDRTNPFYAQLLGEWEQRAGDTEAADRAFREAAAARGAPWKDLITLSTRLELIGASEAADRAFQTGLERFEEIGIARERLYSVVTMVLTFMIPVDDEAPAYQAIRGGDVDTVDRLARRNAELFPYVESGYMMWSRLAEWFEEQGRPELAQQWRYRAEVNREGTKYLFDGATAWSDRALLGMGAIAVTLFFLSLVIGLRSGLVSRERKRKDETEDSPRAKRWINAFRLRDFVALFVLYGALFGCALALNINVVAAGGFVGMPMATFQDSLAAPEVEEWLETLHESPAQQELIHLSRDERLALEMGTPMPPRESIHDLIDEAVYADARHQQWRQLRSGRLPNIFENADIASWEWEDSPHTEDWHVARVIFGLPGIAMMILFGFVVGRFLPRLSTWTLRLIPGGPANLAPVGGFMLLAVVAGLLALAGMDSIFRSLSTPYFPRYFGLDDLELSDEILQPARTWVWFAFASVVSVQVWAVVRDGSEHKDSGGDWR